MAQIVYTSVPRSELRSLTRSIPKAIAGTGADPHGIGEGFRNRLAWALVSLISENLETRLSLGKPGIDGTTWPPLSREYLAYGRRWSGPNKRHRDGRVTPLAGGLWPGNRDSFMNRKQLAQWWVNYRRALAWTINELPEQEAKGMAAAIATNAYKRAGGRTKLWDKSLGGRVVGTDYQIGRNTGQLFLSLSPGKLTEYPGGQADYDEPEGQKYDNSTIGVIIVGTNVAYAAAFAKKRPLWPDPLPREWIDEMLEVAASGLTDIAHLYQD